VPLHLVRFAEAGLAHDSSDRVVWRFAQERHLLLLTDNRNMDGADSLEATLRDDNDALLLPVITIGRIDRVFERSYRARCAIRLLEIVLDLDTYRGSGHLFIP
jgi:hypothetical protein